MNLEGILRLHAKRCIDLGCACQHLLAMNSDNDYQEKLWYQWVKTLIIQGIEKFPKSARLKILSSNLKREKLHAQFQALFDLSSISTTKWTIDQEYAVFKGQDIIEQQMIIQDKLKSEERGVDFNKVISFHKNVGILEALLIEATEDYLSFWTELLQTIPKMNTLDRCGASIIAVLDKISKKYRKLTKVNPYNNELIKMYGSFQKEVVNNQKEAKRELEKLESTVNTLATKRLRHNSEYKIIDNPNICLLTVSGHFKTMGLVKDVTNEITKILGYSKSELIGQNINIIMPRVVRDVHDQFMLNYFETSHANTIGLETRVFPLNKSGYIQPCTILVHLVPNLNEGITLIGFLAEAQYDIKKQKHYYKDASRVYYIMYNAGNQVVQGISETCYEDFGIPSSLVDETEMTENFTLDKILPEIEDLSEEELKGADGVATVVDTTNLHEEFLIPDPESLDPKHFDPEHQGSIQIYRRARVCAKIIEESRYGEALVRVIRLIELPDEDDAQGELAFKLQNRKEDISTDTAQTDSENSDIESVSQDEPEGTIGSLINENVGELAYIRSLTAQKSSKKLTRGLAITGFALAFIIIGFEIFQYVIFRREKQEFEGGFVNLNKGLLRHALIPNLNYRARQLDLLSKYQLSSSIMNSSEFESAIRSNFSDCLSYISTAQYDLVVFSETHQDDDSFSIANKKYLFEIMLDNTYKIESMIYESGFIKYFIAATQIRNASVSNFIPNSNIIDPTVDNFFIIRRNGLGPLRNGSETLIEAYYSYYLQRIDYYRTIILIAMIVTLLMLVFSRVLLVINFLAAHKANYKAFSILGYVPPETTHQLIEKCHKYLDQSLYSDRGDTENKNIVEGASQSSRRNDSEINKSQESNDKRRLSQRSQDEQSNFTHQMENSEFHDVSENIQVSPMEFVTERRNAIASPGLSSHRGLLEIDSARLKPIEPKEAPPPSREEPIKSQVLALNMNAKKQEAADEKFEENVEDRIQKLQESGKREKIGMIIRMFFVVLPWLFVHVLEFLLFHEGFFRNVEKSFEHLKLFSYQQGNLWYIDAFTLEEIAEAQNFTSLYSYPGQSDTINWRVEFQGYIQSGFKQLASANWQDLPSAFDTYLDLLNYAMNGNLCSDVFITTETEAECTEFANGLMTQGLSMVMTTLVLNFDDVIANFQNALISIDNTNNGQVNQTIVDALSTTKYQQTELISNKLNSIFGSLREVFEVGYISFLGKYEDIALIKFLVVILVISVASIIAWIKFGSSVASKLILTRKTLALMPFELFMKNKNFRMHFFSDE